MLELLELIADMLGGGGGSDPYKRRRAKRLARRTKVACALRVVSGSHPQLGPTWRQGSAKLAPGRIRQGRAVLDVTRVERAQVDLTDADSTMILADLVVVRVHTPTAVLEWALRRDRLPWALTALGQR